MKIFLPWLALLGVALDWTVAQSLIQDDGTVLTPDGYPVIGETTQLVRNGSLAPTALWLDTISWEKSGENEASENGTQKIFTFQDGIGQWGGPTCGRNVVQANGTTDIPPGTDPSQVGIASVLQLEATKYAPSELRMYCGGYQRRRGDRFSTIQMDMKCRKSGAATATFRPQRTLTLLNWWVERTVDLEPYFNNDTLYDEWVHIEVPMTDFQDQVWSGDKIEFIRFWQKTNGPETAMWPECNVTNVIFKSNRIRPLGVAPGQAMVGKQRSRVVWVGKVAPRIISMAFDVVPNEIEPVDWSLFPWEVNGVVSGPSNTGRFTTTRFEGSARNSYPMILRHEIFLRVPEAATNSNFQFYNVTTPFGVLDATRLNDDTKALCLSLSINSASYTGRVGTKQRRAVLGVWAGDLDLDLGTSSVGGDYFSPDSVVCPVWKAAPQ